MPIFIFAHYLSGWCHYTWAFCLMSAFWSNASEDGAINLWLIWKLWNQPYASRGGSGSTWGNWQSGQLTWRCCLCVNCRFQVEAVHTHGCQDFWVWWSHSLLTCPHVLTKGHLCSSVDRLNVNDHTLEAPPCVAKTDWLLFVWAILCWWGKCWAKGSSWD